MPRSDRGDRGAGWVFGGQSHAAMGCYCTKGRVSLPLASWGWTDLQDDFSFFLLPNCIPTQASPTIVPPFLSSAGKLKVLAKYLHFSPRTVKRTSPRN